MERADRLQHRGAARIFKKDKKNRNLGNIEIIRFM